MKKPKLWLAILLNIFMLPMGYYYLKSSSRFIIFTLYFLFGSTIASFLFWIMPEITWGKIHLLSIFVFSFLMNVFIVFDTIKILKTGVKSEKKFFRQPYAWLFIFTYYSIAFTFFYTFEKYEKPFFKTHNIASNAMSPTLQTGDYIFADYFIDTSKIQRGDIVVYKPGKSQYLTGANLIGRIVAIPGDKIKVIHHEIYINNEKCETKRMDRLSEELILKHLDLSQDEQSNLESIHIFSEKITRSDNPDDFFEHSIMKATDQYSLFSDMEELILPADKYFVMGDHRDNSYDSRGQGFIDRKNILAKYAYTYFSLDLNNRSCPQDDDNCKAFSINKILTYKIRNERIGLVAK